MPPSELILGPTKLQFVEFDNGNEFMASNYFFNVKLIAAIRLVQKIYLTWRQSEVQIEYLVVFSRAINFVII